MLAGRSIPQGTGFVNLVFVHQDGHAGFYQIGILFNKIETLPIQKKIQLIAFMEMPGSHRKFLGSFCFLRKYTGDGSGK